MKEYVYKSTLSRVYGLTPGLIEELGAPDESCDNPHYQSGPSASLYRIERVEAWIDANKERVERARATRAKQSASAKRVHDEKRAARFQKAQEWITSLAIRVERPLSSTLLDDARRCYEFHGHEDCLSERGLHAYVRHRLTNYEDLLRELYQQEFSPQLYPLLQARVDAVVRAALAEWVVGTTFWN